MNTLTNSRIKELYDQCDQCDEGQEGSELLIAFARIIETEVAAPFIKEITELKEQLLVYQQAEMAALKESNAKRRAQEIVELLFPPHNVRDLNVNPPMKWHEKSWWWKGASIVWHETDGFDSEGGEVKIESYVGGGETDSTIIYIRKEWLDAKDGAWQSLVENYKQQKFGEKQEQIKLAAVEKANAEIAAAMRILQKHGVKD